MINAFRFGNAKIVELHKHFMIPQDTTMRHLKFNDGIRIALRRSTFERIGG